LDDEQKIRQVVADWMAATIAGDIDKIVPLMTDDVTFLIAGHPPIRGRDQFIATQREVFSHLRIEPKSDIQEIRVSGDLASCWTHLTANIIPAAGAPMKRSGYTLTVFCKNSEGNWQVWRDANLLTETE
jgi:uncharacterized protein (TIGR02246 family)